MVRLAAVIGRSTATELLLGAETIDGQRAYELGFVQRCGDLEIAESWATQTAGLASLSIRAQKLALGVTTDAELLVPGYLADTNLFAGRPRLRD